MFTLQTSSRGEGRKTLKTFRLLSQSRPRIRLQVSKFKINKNEISRDYLLTIPLIKVDRMLAYKYNPLKKKF
jgi:hypothetical protein